MIQTIAQETDRAETIAHSLKTQNDTRNAHCCKPSKWTKTGANPKQTTGSYVLFYVGVFKFTPASSFLCTSNGQVLCSRIRPVKARSGPTWGPGQAPKELPGGQAELSLADAFAFAGSALPRNNFSRAEQPQVWLNQSNIGKRNLHQKEDQSSVGGREKIGLWRPILFSLSLSLYSKLVLKLGWLYWVFIPLCLCWHS